METRWTLIEQASLGDEDARSDFVDAYMPIVRRYLAARWRSSVLKASLDDAAQDVFMECLKPAGALEKVDPDGPARFRTWLYRVTLNVARRHEERARKNKKLAEEPEALADSPAREATLSLVFDRSWARVMVRRAALRMRREAHSERAQKRLELLELRFEKGQAIRDIAQAWNEPAAKLHHEYATARDEFKRALLAEIKAHSGADIARCEAEVRDLINRI